MQRKTGPDNYGSLLDRFRLDGQRALVTGASRGIGRGIARGLAEAGADIILVARTEQDLAAAQDELSTTGRKIAAVAADLGNAAEIESWYERVVTEQGPIDILVNNAGIIRPQPLDEITERDWDELHDANLKSAFLVTQAVVPGMRERRWGRIIFLSSVAAQLGGVVGPHYASAKAGLFGLTHSYAALLAKEGITVNTIAPALIETEMVTSNPRARPDLLPVGRFGTVEEVADVALMLARNGYITGQTFNVNGGWYMS